MVTMWISTYYMANIPSKSPIAFSMATIVITSGISSHEDSIFAFELDEATSHLSLISHSCWNLPYGSGRSFTWVNLLETIPSTWIMHTFVHLCFTCDPSSYSSQGCFHLTSGMLGSFNVSFDRNILIWCNYLSTTTMVLLPPPYLTNMSHPQTKEKIITFYI
jgi:hypothetical protein